MAGQPLPSSPSTEEEIYSDDEGVGQDLVLGPPHGAATQHDAQIGESETENSDGVDEIAVEAVGGENSNSTKKIANKPVDMKNGEPVVKYFTLQQRGNLVVFGPPLRSSSSEPESDTHPPRTTGATVGQLQASNSVTSRKRSLRKTLNSPRSWLPSHGDATSKDSTTDSSDVDTTSDSDEDEEGAGAGKIHGESPPVIKRGRGRPRKKVKSSDDGVGVGTPSAAVQFSKQPSHQKYQCVSCDKSYNAITGLRCHRLNYHRLDESKFPFSCKVAACERRFETRKEMKNHLQYGHRMGSTEMFTQDEDGKKSFKCEHCRRTFRSRSTLTFHKIKVHPSAGLKQFACAHCNNKYYSKSGLRKHILKQHTV